MQSTRVASACSDLAGVDSTFWEMLTLAVVWSEGCSPRHIVRPGKPPYDPCPVTRGHSSSKSITFLTFLEVWSVGVTPGIEGTLSQGVRAFGLRRSRYVGEAKTRLQMCMTAVAINVVRLGAWIEEQPRGLTRRSRFAALAPTG